MRPKRLPAKRPPDADLPAPGRGHAPHMRALASKAQAGTFLDTKREGDEVGSAFGSTEKGGHFARYVLAVAVFPYAKAHKKKLSPAFLYAHVP